MADLPELTEQERWLLVECCDVEEDFPQLIYYLHFAFPGLSIWEKYRLAQELIAGVVGKGVMEVDRIAYEEDSPGRLRIVSVTPVPLDELRRVWDHPLMWDPERVYSAPELLGLSEGSPERLAIGPTALGHRVLEKLMEGR
ncbi:MAG TPA: hypothetical protein VF179_29950 [Thermoanaerobaculia bacterium]|nr:hypothetical protein [Thermoanaerobaculia bacterium]